MSLPERRAVERMADIKKVIKGLEHELENRGKCGHYCYEEKETVSCPYDKKGLCIQHWGNDALALLKAQEKRHALEVHNISNVKIPEGVTMEQFHAVMNNVVEALEHTDRGELWPYDDGEGEKDD